MPALILARHGETDVIGKKLTGRINGIHLNASGRKQADVIAAYLKSLKIGAIFSSPLERAMETARPLSEACGIPISPHSGLTEINFGAWQGRPYRQLEKLKLWQTIQTSPSRVTFPAGESFITARQRMVASLEEIVSVLGKNDVAVCFSHCDPIRLAIAYFLNMALDDFQRLTIEPGSLSLVIFIDGKIRLGPINFQAAESESPFRLNEIMRLSMPEE
ncbi:MAG: phosphoglycerate mutase [Leptolinea sp.]|jgi:probable phosphoglycerate mutase|nr:phosphoglycerate mutase [Leptolinea sp.]